MLAHRPCADARANLCGVLLLCCVCGLWVVVCVYDTVLLQRPPMMHRDLKSPNVLLSEEGVAKIADVGMVRSQVKDLVTAQPVMTPLWAAPEVRGCDQKALGARLGWFKGDLE